MEITTFGQRLVTARKGAGFKQRHVAERFHVEKTTVSRWENNEYRPTLERIGELAEFFGESATWLAFGTGERKQSPAPALIADVADEDDDDAGVSAESGEHTAVDSEDPKQAAGAA